MDWHAAEDATVLMYVEDSLSLAERRRFETHLDECQACRLDLDATRRLHDLTQSWAQEEPPAHLAQAIRSKLQPRSHRRGWMLAAAAILLLFIGVHAWKPGPAPSVPVVPVLAQSHPPSPEQVPSIALTTEKVWTTQADSSVIALAGQVLTLGPHSELQVISQSGNRYVLKLSQGDVRVQEHGETIAVVTEYLRVDPMGTDYQVFHAKEGSRVRLFSGQVRVTTRRTGQVTDLSPGGNLEYPPRKKAASQPKPPASSPSPSPHLPELAYPVRIPTAVPTLAAPTPTATLPIWDVPPQQEPQHQPQLEPQHQANQPQHEPKMRMRPEPWRRPNNHRPRHRF